MKFLNALLATVITLFSAFAFAGGSYSGKFRPLYYGDSLYFTPIDAVVSGKPECATRANIRLTGSPTSAEFQQKFSILLAAWMANRGVDITGTGECTAEGDELIRSIQPK